MLSIAFTKTRRFRATAVTAAVTSAMLGTSLVPMSSGDLQSQIDSSRSSANSLHSQINAETARIQQTAGGIADAERRLSAVQAELSAR